MVVLTELVDYHFFQLSIFVFSRASNWCGTVCVFLCFQLITRGVTQFLFSTQAVFFADSKRNNVSTNFSTLRTRKTTRVTYLLWYQDSSICAVSCAHLTRSARVHPSLLWSYKTSLRSVSAHPIKIEALPRSKSSQIACIDTTQGWSPTLEKKKRNTYRKKRAKAMAKKSYNGCNKTEIQTKHHEREQEQDLKKIRTHRSEIETAQKTQ